MEHVLPATCRPGKILVVISKSGDALPEGQVLAERRPEGHPGARSSARAGTSSCRSSTPPSSKPDNVVVKPGKVGIVTALGGTPLPPGRVLAEDGEQGIRREVLLPGSYRLNPYGYEVEHGRHGRRSSRASSASSARLG